MGIRIEKGILTAALAALLVVAVLPATMFAKAKETFVVAIDAGHGGKDIGATDNGAKEKDINLGVAKELARLIERKMKNTEVVMTRDNDTYLTLQQRADKANKAKANLFVSIHTNSVDKSNKNRRKVEGSSVYVLGLHKDANNMAVARRENSVIELEENFEERYSGFDPSKDESYIIFEMAQKKNLSKSIRFAKDIQRNLALSGRTDRGVHQAGFWVLWATSMPSVLVELDFICNPESAKYMTSEKGQKQLAESIFKAIEDYEKNFRDQKEEIKEKRRKGDHVADMPGETVSSVEMVAEKSVEAKEEGKSGEKKVKTTTKDGIAVLAKAERSHKMESAPAGRSNRGSYASARKRRSRSAKEASDKKSYEVSSIPVKSEDERMARIIAEGGASAAISDGGDDGSGFDNPKDKKKKKKDKKKKEKKEKKKKDRKGKKDKNGKEVGSGMEAKANPSHKAKREKFVTVYKIQVLASPDDISADSPRFCGLSPITSFKENNLYKYTYGESENKSEIEALLKKVRTYIPDAFIIKSIKSR